MTPETYSGRLIALLLILTCAARVEADGTSDVAGDLEDGTYLTACGPIACYIALKAAGIDTTLPEMVKACGWKKGELTTLDSMYRALRSKPSVACVATRVPVDRLAAMVDEGRSIAILPIRKGGEDINHAVCVARARDNRFLVIDYPELGSWKSPAELADIWDGEVLLVSRKAPDWYARENAWWIGPSAGGLGAILLVGAARVGRRETAGARMGE